MGIVESLLVIFAMGGLLWWAAGFLPTLPKSDSKIGVDGDGI